MALAVSVILAFFLPRPWNFLIVLGGLLIETVELTWGLRLAKRWRAQTGAEAMIGETATVVAACRPLGQVRIAGELWAARCEAGAEVGETVRITGLEQLTLTVVPAEAEAPAAGS